MKNLYLIMLLSLFMVNANGESWESDVTDVDNQMVQCSDEICSLVGYIMCSPSALTLILILLAMSSEIDVISSFSYK